MPHYFIANTSTSHDTEDAPEHDDTEVQGPDDDDTDEKIKEHDTTDEEEDESEICEK